MQNWIVFLSLLMLVACASKNKESQKKVVKTPEYIKIFKNHKKINSKNVSRVKDRKEELNIIGDKIFFLGYGIYNGQEEYFFNSPIKNIIHKKSEDGVYQISFDVVPGKVYRDRFDVTNKTGIRMLPQGRDKAVRKFVGWLKINELGKKEYLTMDLVCTNNCFKTHYRFESFF